MTAVSFRSVASYPRAKFPMDWGEVGYTTTGPTVNRVRSSSDKVDGNYSFPLDIEPFDDLGTSKDWFQRRPGGGPGGRYLMSGWGKCAIASSLRLIAVVRDHAGALSEQKAATSMAANTWTSSQVRADMPGDAQVARTVPVLHQFRAGIDTPYGAPNTTGFLDDLKVNALSQLYQYDGENLDGTVGADGARVTLVRDRFGRVRQMVDPARRTVDFTYDVEDRLVLVRDSRGLTLSYLFDWLGNLVQFTDSRSQETTFIYDDLNRLLEIVQPDPAQNELFEYSPAGDLTSYTNLRGEERQFFYDAAHRLVRVDYLLTPVESIELSYDPNGNLLRLLERNGDQLRMSYDSLNRLLLSQRKSLAGPQWAFRNVYDAAGNRSGLTTNLPVYGTALYGTDAYLSGSDSYFTAAFNARRQMESLQDGLSHESSFGYNADGMLVEVDHPNGTPALKTRHRYDLVGKLLETQVLQDTDPLWKVAYGYNLAADRLSQHSLWPEGGNSYRYELDASGRLVRETINRFVLASVDQWASGDLRLTGFDDQATLRLISRDDSLAAQQLDLQRWDLAITDPVATQVLVKPGDGLHWVTSHGDTQRGGRVVSHILHHTSDNTAYDYPSQTFSVSDNIGWLAGRMLMRHRLPLEGEFDVRVSISEWQLFDCFIGLGVTRERYETSAPGNKYPPSTSGAINANGCDIVAGFDGGSDENRVIFNNYTLSDVTAQGLRLRRYLDGSTWMLEGFYHDGTTWVSHANWVDEFDGQTLYAYLHLSGKYGHVRWTDFVETEGAQFRVSSVSGTESVNQAAWPCYESQIYDAGQSVDWSKLSWTETLPTNTDVRLQLAISDDPDGPWSYAGPSGVNTYYSTAAGHTLTSLTGRYCRFRAFLYSTDGADTPELSNVHLSHTGTSDSRMTTYEYDDAGNLLEIAITDDTGTTTETRTVNDLNQIDTATGGWEFLYDDNGCLIEKNNGTGVGDEKWEFSWNEDDRLTQVKKGVYNATPVLVNEFTVDYTYDSMGRMLTRDDGTDVTTFVWDGWDLLSETTDSVTTDYLVPNGLIHSFLRDGDLYVCHVDALGSVRMVTDDAGDVVAQFEHGAYGKLLDGGFDSVPGGMPFGFIGGLGVRTDATTGLLYMRNRWYSPSVQRFISRDPIGLRGGANLYAYVGNRPTDAIDPYGLDATTATVFGARLAAAAAEVLPAFAAAAAEVLPPVAAATGIAAGYYAAGQIYGPTIFEDPMDTMIRINHVEPYQRRHGISGVGSDEVRSEQYEDWSPNERDRQSPGGTRTGGDVGPHDWRRQPRDERRGKPKPSGGPPLDCFNRYLQCVSRVVMAFKDKHPESIGLESAKCWQTKLNCDAAACDKKRKFDITTEWWT